MKEKVSFFFSEVENCLQIICDSYLYLKYQIETIICKTFRSLNVYKIIFDLLRSKCWKYQYAASINILCSREIPFIYATWYPKTSNNILLQGWYLLQAINCKLFCMVLENMDMKKKIKKNKMYLYLTICS